MSSYRFTHVRFLVDDVQAVFRFYRDVLGLKTESSGEGPYVEFETGEVTLSFFDRGMMAGAIGHPQVGQAVSGPDTVLIWLRVENVDAAVKALEARGVKIITPPTDRPQWGLRTAHFRDPGGILVEIGHDIPMH